MSDDLSGLGGPTGLGPGEKVPNQLRILAAQENLGNLISVHRPATRLTRLLLKGSRIYRYDKGLVISNGRGGFSLFDWEHSTAEEKGGTWLLARNDGARFRLTRHWTGYEELGRALASR